MIQKPAEGRSSRDAELQRAAVAAWCGIDATCVAPQRVEVVRHRNKSHVYRLHGVGAEGSNVIAKACFADTGSVEHDIYANVLPRLPVTQLRYYGFKPEPGRQFSWLFLEEAGGVMFDPAHPPHRSLATRWLAQLHTASAAMAVPPPLPERGPAHYRQHMSEARALIEEHHGNPTFEGGERETLDRILEHFDVVESRWSEIDALCGLVPLALIHGDFAERNVRVRPKDRPSALYAFDWEVAGWGPPIMDLALADVRLYWSLVRDHWCNLDHATLCRLTEVGKLLRGGIAATNWTAVTLATEWPLKAIEDMRVYDRRMTAAMKAIGWAA